jgi:hypothetical protein
MHVHDKYSGLKLFDITIIRSRITDRNCYDLVFDVKHVADVDSLGESEDNDLSTRLLELGLAVREEGFRNHMLVSSMMSEQVRVLVSTLDIMHSLAIALVFTSSLLVLNTDNHNYYDIHSASLTKASTLALKSSSLSSSLLSWRWWVII